MYKSADNHPPPLQLPWGWVTLHYYTADSSVEHKEVWLSHRKYKLRPEENTSALIIAMLLGLVCGGYPRLVIGILARMNQLMLKNDCGKTKHD